MIEKIPEKIIKKCDRCKKVVKDDFACNGSVVISGRDMHGVFVGGYDLKIQLCDCCADGLNKWVYGKR